MASPEILDFASLIAPISEEFPAGQDAREDPSPVCNYQIIKGERNTARAVERNSIHDGSSGESDVHWRKIIEIAPQFISRESKDLEVCSWLIEALIRHYGFQGLRDGFKLVQGLIEHFWDNLYPLPDEYGIETRVSPLSGLNGEGAEGVLIAPIRKIAITEGHSIGPFSLWEYQQALNNDKISDDDLKSKKQSQLGFTLEDVEKAISESSQEFLVNLRDDVSECITYYKSIGLQLDELCGAQDAPSIRNIINVLEESLGAINHLGKNKFPIESAPEETVQNDDSATANSVEAPVMQTSQLQTREHAFKQILELAEFFRKTEPHSPVSYILEKAVKWGQMPLNELMQELITDNSSLERFSDLTGVKVEN